MLSVNQFNGLGGTTATRESLIEIRNNAINDGNEEVVSRIDALLDAYPKGEIFEDIELDDFVIEPVPESFLHGLDYEEIADEGEGLGRVSPAEVYDMITDKVIKMIAEANLPGYKKKWKSSEYGTGYTIPFNFVTKKRYRGINVLMLTELEPLENPFFLTFKQVNDLKGKVKKGAKGYEVVYFTKIWKTEDKPKNLKFSSYDKTKVETFRTENSIENDLGVIPMLKYYHVYNGSDIEGIDFKLASFKTGFIDAEKPSTEDNKMPIPEAIIKNYPKPQPTLKFGGNRAFYQPGKDHVQMPYLADFETVQDYYRTLLHEFSHSTGASKRLKRDFSGSFGSKPYAFEELVAELGAIFLSAESGIIWHNNTNHAAYLKSWNNALIQIKDDNKFIMRASTAAQKVADFVLQFDDNGDPLYFDDLKKLIEKKAVAKAKPVAKKTPEQLKEITKNAKALIAKKQALKDKFAEAGAKTPAERKKGNVPEKAKQLGQLLSEYAILSNRILRFKTKKSIAETKTFDQLNERLEKVIQEIASLIDGKYSEAMEYVDEWIQKKNNVFVFDEKSYLQSALQAYGKTKPAEKPVPKVQKKDEETVLGYKKESFSTTSKAKAVKKQAVKKIVSGKKKTKEQLEKANAKPFAIKPESTATIAAIKAVLTLPKYKGINAQQAQILYKTFKDETWDDEYTGFYLEKPIKTAYEIARMKSETNFHYYSNEQITIWELGFDLVQTIKNRLESLHKQNNNYALFDGLKVPITGNIEDIFTPEPEKVFMHDEPKEEKVNLPLNTNSLAYRRQNRNNTTHEYYQIDNPNIADFLGKIEKKKKDSVAITIAGGQGSGKTSFVFQLINEFAKHYKVGHASIEEHPESALYEDKAERFWNENAKSTVDSPEINTKQDIHELILRNDVIVIDSFSKLLSMDRKITLDETFRKKYDGKLFIIIYQLTTDGSMRGGSSSQFDGDVILFVEKFPSFSDNYVYADKNRYQTANLEELHYNIATAKLMPPEQPEEEISFTEEVERI